jgi:DNA-binding transcriptional MerR regulator
MESSARRSWRIGELAAEVQLNPKTIRFYEAIGLLPAPPRTAGGYRKYGPADRERLHFILKTKALGFSLHEIGELLVLRDGGKEPCALLGPLLDQKLAQMDDQLVRLLELRGELQTLRIEMATTPCVSTPICGPIERHASARPVEDAEPHQEPLSPASVTCADALTFQ